MDNGTTTTVVGWSLILAVGGLSYWQYRSTQAKNQVASAAKRPVPVAQRTGSKDRLKKEKGERLVNKVETPSKAGDSEQAKKRKKKQDGPSQSAVSSAVDPKPEPPRAATSSKRDTQEMDDAAFAQQLASKQMGTSFKATERTKQKVRTNKVKSGNSGEKTNEWQGSGPSSSNGGDDEDVLPAVSPALNGVTSSSDPTTDMLEEPAPGPASLRVTPSEKPQRETNPRQAKPEQEGETKKQRQRRRKREAEKAQAASDETARRQLMEKQLKTARTAEGTAKSGQYRTYTSSTNAWNQSGPTPAKNITAIDDTGLLDTFETDDTPVPKPMEETTTIDAPSDESRPSIDSEPASSAAGSVGGDRAEPVIVGSHETPRHTASGQPSDAWEDYQVRRIEQRAKKDTDGWQEVPSKGKKKAVK